ncbi:MAG: DegV family EDD domain-containing protein [Firmicutes bacterium]|nr:DegV family EDD domain-containing protein [Bacillota bacterium]
MRIGMKIDGVLLRGLLISGFHNLCNSVEYLNDINVFPVSDGDTGTNMKRTFEAGINAMVGSASFSKVFSSFVEGMLLGSRGNSGLILSQYCFGLYESIKGKDNISALELCDALMDAYDAAYKALLKPVEGTILTVMLESAKKTKTRIDKDTSFENFFDIFSAEIYSSLQQTTAMLKVLRENGVVDSGAAGFYLIFDGIRKGIYGNNLGGATLPSYSQAPSKVKKITREELKFRYCTEFTLKLEKSYDREEIVDLLKDKGDSIVIAENGGILKVHIHTNDSQSVLDEFKSFGGFIETKIDDMAEQQKSDYSYAIIGDITCDLSENVRKRFGVDGYIKGHMTIPDGSEIISTLDWSYMPSEEFYTHLKANSKKYKTAPASVGEIVRYGEQFLQNGKDLLMISISSKLSVSYNLMLNAAKLLEEKYPDRKVLVIDSKKYSVGVGQLILKACQLRKEGMSIEENAKELELIKHTIHQMGTMDDLFFVASKGRISNAKAFLGTLIKIKTLGDFDADGMVSVIGKIKGKGHERAYKVIIEYIKNTIVNPKEQIIIVANSQRGEQARVLKALIEEHIAPKEVILSDIYPATGINAGPGLVAAYYFGTPITDLKNEREIMDSLMKGMK